jgi:hypothetical protein
MILTFFEKMDNTKAENDAKIKSKAHFKKMFVITSALKQNQYRIQKYVELISKLLQSCK